MRLVVPLRDIGDGDVPLAGGKAVALSRLSRAGIEVPDGVCVTVNAYVRFAELTGLGERLSLILGRKSLADLRWEEIWDVALRIRNLFLNTTLPPELRSSLGEGLARFAGVSAVVRSSSPAEDAAGTSFAGLHESFVNVRGVESILAHVLLVWASLWSDRALLYRKELDLDTGRSAMAVVVQELVEGDKSGVAFSAAPGNDSLAAVESVYGLNQGLVDGTIEPDAWLLERATGKVVEHREASRTQAVRPSAGGTVLEELPARHRETPPLGRRELERVFETVMRVEHLFKNPQDMEWTFRDRALYVLQARPVTARAGDAGTDGYGEKPWERSDRRSWYLSLTRSLENLKKLRARIEHEIIPRMDADAEALSGIEVRGMADPALADEIDRRSAIHRGWVDRYYAELIPFAHGARLFGQFYNDAVRPADPFEFTELLGSGGLEGLDRNRRLAEMAAIVRGRGEFKSLVETSERRRETGGVDAGLARLADAFLADFGATAGAFALRREDVLRLVVRMAEAPVERVGAVPRGSGEKTEVFLRRFAGEERKRAEELLELGRASYRMRDNDNLHLARVESRLLGAVEEGKRRLEGLGIDAAMLDSAQVAAGLRDPSKTPVATPVETAVTEPVELKDNPRAVPWAVRELEGGFKLSARQLTGQPAGRGVAAGTARVVLGGPDLLAFIPGEILVCDAIDPSMTFVVPLAAGVVERRGGMLIHGAIIAREYGLPCVTGVPNATSLIKTGDSLVVDGYLGIVTLAEDGGGSRGPGG